MPFRAETLHAASGASIHVHILDVEAPRGIVQINHGLAEHSARYEPFAEFLASRGYATFAHDHRGHGQTRAPGAPPGRFAAQNGHIHVVDDAAAVLDLIAHRFLGAPIIAFGHSMGGLVALNLAMRHGDKIKGLAIWNSNFRGGPGAALARVVLAWERFRIGSDVPSRLLPKATFRAWNNRIANPRTGFDWLSRDPAAVDGYVADPLCGWDASVSLWQDLFALMDAGSDDGALKGMARDLPINLVGGAEDPATDGGKAVSDLARRLERNGFSNLQSRIYAETRHESLNELNRHLIMADFAAWADGITIPGR